jgi:ABC-type antimicrobial peptide transport system permease subunit
MNYEIGLSSSTINALRDLSGFSLEKIQQLFPIFRRQAIIEGWIGTAIAVVLISVYVFILIKTRNVDEYEFGNFEKVFIGIILIGVAIALLIAFIPNILNPDYQAIDKLRSIIR